MQKVDFQGYINLMTHDNENYQPRPGVFKRNFIEHLKATYTFEHFEFWIRSQAWIADIMTVPCCYEERTGKKRDANEGWKRAPVLRGLQRAQVKVKESDYYQQAFIIPYPKQEPQPYEGTNPIDKMYEAIESARQICKEFMLGNSPKLINTGHKLQKAIKALKLQTVAGQSWNVKHPKLSLQDEVAAWMDIMLESEREVSWLLYNGSFGDFQKKQYRKMLIGLSASMSIWYLDCDLSDFTTYPVVVNEAESRLINLFMGILFATWAGIHDEDNMLAGAIIMGYLIISYASRAASGPRLDPIWQMIGSGLRKYVVAEGWMQDQFVPGEPKRVAEGIYCFLTVIAAASWFVGGDHLKDAIGLMEFMAVSTLVCTFTGFCLPFRVHQCYFPPPVMELEVDIDYENQVVWGAGGGKKKSVGKKVPSKTLKKTAPKKKTVPKKAQPTSGVMPDGNKWRIEEKLDATGKRRKVKIITKKSDPPLPSETFEIVEKISPKTGKMRKVKVITRKKPKSAEKFRIVQKVDPKTGRSRKVKIITKRLVAGPGERIKIRTDPKTGAKKKVLVKIKGGPTPAPKAQAPTTSTFRIIEKTKIDKNGNTVKVKVKQTIKKVTRVVRKAPTPAPEDTGVEMADLAKPDLAEPAPTKEAQPAPTEEAQPAPTEEAQPAPTTEAAPTTTEASAPADDINAV